MEWIESSREVGPPAGTRHIATRRRPDPPGRSGGSTFDADRSGLRGPSRRRNRVFVACNTLCFSREPMESAIRHIADLEFRKIDLALHEGETHLRPSEVAESLEAALGRRRDAPSMTPSAYGVDFGDAEGATYRKRFEAICRPAKAQTVAVLTIPASPIGTPFDDEVKRLGV